MKTLEVYQEQDGSVCLRNEQWWTCKLTEDQIDLLALNVYELNDFNFSVEKYFLAYAKEVKTDD